MQRDMDLVRKLLESIAGSRKVEANGINTYHLQQMEHAGLINSAAPPGKSVDSPKAPAVKITGCGKEFLAASGNEPAWSYLKKVSAHMGGMALFTAKEILQKLTNSQTTQDRAVADVRQPSPY